MTHKKYEEGTVKAHATTLTLHWARHTHTEQYYTSVSNIWKHKQASQTSPSSWMCVCMCCGKKSEAKCLQLVIDLLSPVTHTSETVRHLNILQRYFRSFVFSLPMCGHVIYSTKPNAPPPLPPHTVADGELYIVNGMC